jgi:transcription initiation factor TFIIIB Brf1 subunit/transcription initiation factor TFIIB
MSFTDSHLDEIWSQAKALLETESSMPNVTSHREKCEQCGQCGGKEIYHSNNEIVCVECGLILGMNQFDSTPQFESNPVQVSRRSGPTNHKLTKLQNWYMWTNEEKNAYKLSNYTKTLCNQLSVHESLVSNICETVIHVMGVIKKYDGTKRARVKDGIILVCIQYVSKSTSLATQLSTVDLAKKLRLDIKYITKADKLILELVNNGKLNFCRHSVMGVKKPFDYVDEAIQKKKLKIPSQVIERVRWLIGLCETHDILLDHTPMSVGVCCFYYILKSYSISVDTHVFSELYGLSHVTLTKTFNKLKQSDQFIWDKLAVTSI